MNDLVTFTAIGNSTMYRSTKRELRRIEESAAIVQARAEARISMIEHVTESALLATARNSMLEAGLSRQIPHAQGRFVHIADGGAMAMAGVLARVARS